MAFNSSSATPAGAFSISYDPFEETLTDLKRLADTRLELPPGGKATLLCEEHILDKLYLLRHFSRNITTKRLTIEQCLLIGEIRVILKKTMPEADMAYLPDLKILIGDVYQPLRDSGWNDLGRIMNLYTLDGSGSDWELILRAEIEFVKVLLEFKGWQSIKPDGTPVEEEMFWEIVRDPVPRAGRSYHAQF